MAQLLLRLIVLGKSAEQIQLPVNIAPAGRQSVLHHNIENLQQRFPGHSHAVKGAGANQIFHRPLVQFLAAQSGAEIVKVSEGSILLSLIGQLLNHAPTDVFDGHQTKPQVFPLYGKVGLGPIHVRGQQPNAHFLTFSDVLRHFGGIVQNGGKQGSHILLGIVALHIRRAVCHNGVGHGMRLVESIACKVQNLVVNLVGNALRHTVGYAAADVPLRVAVDKCLPLFFDFLFLFLGHGPANHICLPQRESRQFLENLQHLLLIHNAAVSHFQNGFQLRVQIGDLLRVGAALEKFGNTVHGSRPIQRNHSGDVLNAFRFQPHANPGHSRTFQLEHAGGFARGEHFKHLGVIVRHRFNAELRLLFPHQFHRIVQNRQVPQTQKVHFQQTQLFQRGHGVLADHGFVIFRQGHIGIHRLPGNHHTGCMGGGMTGGALQLFRRINEIFQFLIAFVQLPQPL